LRARRTKSPWILIVYLIVAVLIGGLLGDLLNDYIPILNYTKTVGFEPTTLNLGAISITLGLIFKMNLAVLIGLIIAMIIFRGV